MTNKYKFVFEGGETVVVSAWTLEDAKLQVKLFRSGRESSSTCISLGPYVGDMPTHRELIENNPFACKVVE